MIIVQGIKNSIFYIIKIEKNYTYILNNYNMNKQIKDKIDAFLNNFTSDYIEEIKYLKESCKNLLKDFETEKELKNIKQYLFDFFEDDYEENIFNISLSSDITHYINNIKLTYDFCDDGDDNYVKAYVEIKNIKIDIYVDYRLHGHKTGGNFNILFNFNNDKFLFENDSDFIHKDNTFNEIDDLLNKFNNPKKISFYNTKDEIITRLSMFIPKYFYKQIF
jgi:hypothetical protein